MDDFGEDVSGDEDLIAVVGLAGRYPESPDLASFWANLRAGRDCLRTFGHDELDDLGIPASVYGRPNFVPRGTILPDWDRFDGRFFGYTPNQAAIMDPQARIFLETSYEALESAGYDPFDTGQVVGVFAGSNPNDYALLLGAADPTDSLSAFDQLIGVDRDFLSTRVSHNLGLTGPAMTIQTACSTSLVTVHMAAQSLLAYECSMALAGGVSINLRQGVGYFYQEGMILSPTGECRAFDAEAQGTTLGQGCGVAVLKRLADARRDRDTVLAVVRATAINNDGRDKISYTAPSEDGQAAVIATAHELAGIDSDSIDYVETHGTGTLLGDPIEIAALTRAFRAGTNRTQYCAIGSVKTNVGHTDAAAGITGFIKTVLSLVNQELPPSIHFERPNPEIDFANSPFFVNDELTPWKAGETPRRAGVSAFGIGGTNAHVVLEEAEPSPPAVRPTRPQLLLVSGRTSAAADARLADLADALDEGEVSTVDIASTLWTGRPRFEHRRAVVVDVDQAPAAVLAGRHENRVVRGRADPEPARSVWMFSGQGSQYPSMGAGLYEREPAFAEAADRVAAVVDPLLGLDLRALVFGTDGALSLDEAAKRLEQTSVTQPALYLVEHAMAALLRSWGLAPDAVLGHSIGEYAAAVEAGIFDWDRAARLVVERGRLMQEMAPGSMLAVPLAPERLEPYLEAGIELAAENGPGLTVVSGRPEGIERLGRVMAEAGIRTQPLATSHAFHSEMMTEAAAAFTAVVAEAEPQPPQLPMVSNVTGRPLTDDEAIDPAFWSSQIRRPVRFGACVESITGPGPTVFIELGPGRALTGLVGANDGLGPGVAAVATMRHRRQDRHDQLFALEAVAELWACGSIVGDEQALGLTGGRRVPLPTYPFERTEAWLPPDRHVLALPGFGPPSADRSSAVGPGSVEAIDDWLYVPSWQRSPRPDRSDRTGAIVLLAPSGEPGRALARELATAVGDRRSVVTVAGPIDDDRLASVLDDLATDEVVVDQVINAWPADPGPPVDDLDGLDRTLGFGLHATLACARSLAARSRNHPVRLDVVTMGAFSVLGHEPVRPEAAALCGPVRVVPLEYPGLTTRMIDLAGEGLTAAGRAAVIDELLGQGPSAGDSVVALRSGARWVPAVAPRPTVEPTDRVPLRTGGRYLIVGGLGGVGLSIAGHLAEHYRASLWLTSRRGRPVAGDDLDPETARRIELLGEIEATAARLEVAAIDVGDEGAMVELIDRIERDSGPLNGVIVAAGVADQMGAIHRRSREAMTASIASKVHGSLVLERALTGRSVDFVLLSSSIASVLYHNRFGQVGYVTGNCFAEAFASRARQRGLPMTTVAWDDWLDIGMSVRAAQDFSQQFGQEVDLVDRLHSFSPEDGVRLFERALVVDEPVVIVSTTDLGRRIEADVDVVSPFLAQATGADEGVEDEAEDGVESLVRSIWQSLLGYETFEASDDFFELGGDSLQAARMADRLSRALGTELAVDVIFDTPVLAELVALLEGGEVTAPTGGSQADPTSRPTVGPVALSPGQQRFLDRGNDDPNHFNTSVLLRPRTPTGEDRVRSTVADLMARHEALRARLVIEADGGRHQLVVPPDQVPDPVAVVDLSDRGEGAVGPALTAAADEVQRSLDLEAGPVFRVVLFLLPEGEQRILMVTHHLMCDRVSLLIMIDSLETGLAEGADRPVVSRATSMAEWVGAQQRVAVTAEAVDFVERWTAGPWDQVAPLPLDRGPESGDGDGDGEGNRNRLASVVVDRIELSELVPVGDARLDEQLLLGLVSAVADWTGAGVALLDVLGHGRRLPLGVDVSRSVGMFLTYTPVLVEGGGGADRAESLRQLRAQLAEAWQADIVGCFGPQASREALTGLPRPQILFNYVGRSIAGSDQGAGLVGADEDRGQESDPDGFRDHLIAVRAELVAGAVGDVVELSYVYASAAHDHDTVVELAASTRSALTTRS